MSMTITIEIGGDETPFSQYKITKILSDNPYDFTIWLDKYRSITDTDEVVFKQDGSAILKGLIDKVAPSHRDDTGHGLKLTGEDYLQKLDWRSSGDVEYTNEPAELMRAMIASISPITEGTFDNFGSSITLGGNNRSRLEYVKRIRDLIGWEYRLNIDNQLTFQAEVGTDLSDTIVATIGSNAARLNWSKDKKPIKNRIIPFGKGEGMERVHLTGLGYVEDVASINLYGRRDLRLVANDITNTTDLQRYAESVLARLKNPVYTYKVGYRGTKKLYEYDVGDTINLVDSETGVSGDFRIYEIHVKGPPTQVEWILSNRLPRLEYIIVKEDTRKPPTYPSGTTGSTGGYLPILSFNSRYDFETTLSLYTNGIIIDRNGWVWVLRYNFSAGSPNRYTYSLLCLDPDRSMDQHVWSIELVDGAYESPYRFKDMCCGNDNHLYWIPLSSDGDHVILDLGDLAGGAAWQPKAATTVFNLQTNGLNATDFNSVAHMGGVLYAMANSTGVDRYDNATWEYWLFKIEGTSTYTRYVLSTEFTTNGLFSVYNNYPIYINRWHSLIRNRLTDHREEDILCQVPEDILSSYGFQFKYDDGSLVYNHKTGKLQYAIMGNKVEESYTNHYTLFLYDVNLPYLPDVPVDNPPKVWTIVHD